MHVLLSYNCILTVVKYTDTLCYVNKQQASGQSNFRRRCKACVHKSSIICGWQTFCLNSFNITGFAPNKNASAVLIRLAGINLYCLCVNDLPWLLHKFNIQSLLRPKHELKLHVWDTFVPETVCHGH